ncbi:protein LONG AFTER FAR-RED 3 isoform X1 [Punica granatum]|uniref:Protein LONG AFTER FAR-RED 3 isoform X1 n=2 Tax=Punica granatum TaxID=22663 RepID=A0A6P8CV68_PUNGR|nr:protein LONG AFTER FAR-RED 3 isoform X1 [Punica granatum]
MDLETLWRASARERERERAQSFLPMDISAVISTIIVLVLAVLSLPLLNTSYWSNIRSLLPFTIVSPLADLVVKNATIYTSDASLPFADSMAIRSGRILRVGSYSSLQDLVHYGTEELDVGGKVVVPGFIDSHVHLIPGGLQMVRVELRGVSQKDEFVRRIKEAARNSKHGCWILGGGWNNDLWGGALPLASWIDEITPDNPVWLTRMDGHMGLANSLALKAAGVTKSSEDPNGGTIIRNSAGEPSGLLIDSAMELILALIPEASVDERRVALLRASRYALTRGVTTVIDFGRYFPGASMESSWEDLSDVFQWADSSRKMMIRVCLFFPLGTWSRLADLIRKGGASMSEWIHYGGVKAFADGSLGSGSALFHEPYADEPQNHGLCVMESDVLLNMTAAADKSGLQVAVHAIGDKANDLVLDIYESVASTNGVRDRRFRIEHAQHLAPGAAAHFGQQRVVASVQPDHLLDDADSAFKKLGEERAQHGSYLFRSLQENKARLAFGSDWPVVDVNPLGSIRTAMKRIPPGWENAWNPSERVTLVEALDAYTISAAYACFLDKHLGSLSPGKLADFVILSTDSWDEFAAEGSASVIATYLGGAKAYP